MLNKVMLIGHLGRNPELRYTQSGSPVATLNIATDESYTDRDGNKIEKTEWHRVTVFQRLAENCSNYLTKGSLVYVEGSLQTRKWQDQQGQDRYTTEIKAQRVLFLDRKSDRASNSDGDQEFEGNSNRSYQRYPQQRQQGQQEQQGQQSPAAVQQPTTFPQNEDFGPAFPSEVATMDQVPF